MPASPAVAEPSHEHQDPACPRQKPRPSCRPARRDHAAASTYVVLGRARNTQCPGKDGRLLGQGVLNQNCYRTRAHGGGLDGQSGVIHEGRNDALAPRARQWVDAHSDLQALPEFSSLKRDGFPPR